jgi:predicted DNA-binding protein
MPVIRTNLHLPKQLLDRLKRLAKRDGVTFAELVRRAIIDFLAKHGE